jgi:glycoprotein endo-alpha-1,2-mannosidase
MPPAAPTIGSIIFRETVIEVLAVILTCSICWTAILSFKHFAPSPIRAPPVPLDSASPREVWILYFGSWGSPSVDGRWVSWNRTTDRWDHREFVPPDDLPSLHYPLLGAYSSHNKTVLKTHLGMLQSANITALIIPWDGPTISNGTSSFSDQTIKLLFELAPQFSMHIIPLFPTFEHRNKTSLLADIASYKSRYIKQPAHYRRNGKALAIVYDVHELRGSLEVLEATPEMVFMASAVSRGDFLGAFEDGYVGFVTFFATDEASWGSQHWNWRELGEIARERGVEFVPTVSPGYNDSVIDRWHFRAARGRGCSDYYDDRWRSAIDANPTAIMINSFNDWTMGTAIEPVIERENYTLNDNIWCGREPDVFMRKTGEWARKYLGNDGA